jgi:hypothetical protein
MINAQNLVLNMRAAFKQGIDVRFYDFLKSSGSTKWVISADFVISGQHAFNDVFAFTVIPYYAPFDELSAEAKRRLPKDIKHVQEVDADMQDYLSDKRRFSFCFVTDRSRFVNLGIDNARRSIDEIITYCLSWKDAHEQQATIAAFRRLREKAKASGFNKDLLSDIGLLAALYSFLGVEIARHTRADIIGIFADRDKMTGAYRSIFEEFFAINFSGLCHSDGVDEARTRLIVGRPEIGDGQRELWFDDLIRVPDYLAGAMSRWDLKANLVSSDRPKFVQVVEGVIASNPQVAVIRMAFNIFGARCNEIKVHHYTGRAGRPGYDVSQASRIKYELALASRLGMDHERPGRRARLLENIGTPAIRLL